MIHKDISRAPHRKVLQLIIPSVSALLLCCALSMSDPFWGAVEVLHQAQESLLPATLEAPRAQPECMQTSAEDSIDDSGETAPPTSTELAAEAAATAQQIPRPTTRTSQLNSAAVLAKIREAAVRSMQSQSESSDVSRCAFFLWIPGRCFCIETEVPTVLHVCSLHVLCVMLPWCS